MKWLSLQDKYYSAVCSMYISLCITQVLSIFETVQRKQWKIKFITMPLECKQGKMFLFTFMFTDKQGLFNAYVKYIHNILKSVWLKLIVLSTGIVILRIYNLLNLHCWLFSNPSWIFISLNWFLITVKCVAVKFTMLCKPVFWTLNISNIVMSKKMYKTEPYDWLATEA